MTIYPKRRKKREVLSFKFLSTVGQRSQWFVIKLSRFTRHAREFCEHAETVVRVKMSGESALPFILVADKNVSFLNACFRCTRSSNIMEHNELIFDNGFARASRASRSQGTRVPFYCSSVCLVARKPQLRNISMMVVYDRRGGVNRCKLARRLPSPLDEQVTTRSRQRTSVRAVST